MRKYSSTAPVPARAAVAAAPLARNRSTLMQLLALALAAALSLAFTLAASAAPASQAAVAAAAAMPAAAATAGLAGVYVSQVSPAADAMGLVQVLELYENQNAQLLSFYLGKEAPIVEQGTWASDDGATVVLTLTGQGDQPYAAPAVTTYTVDGATLATGGVLFDRLPQVTPADLDAGDTPALPDEPPASDDPAGVYVSALYPAADAAGMLQLLTLYADGNAQVSSIYVAKDAPVVEFGAWQLTDAGDVEVSLTGTVDEAYSEPAVTTYLRGGDGLDDGLFVFARLSEVTSAELAALAAAPAPHAVAGYYVSPAYPAADAPALITVLSLFANQNAQQDSIYVGKATITEQGGWKVDAAGVLTVTLTGTADDTYASPSVAVYVVDGAMLVDGAFVLNKLREVTPAEMDAMTAPAAEPATAITATAAAAVTPVAVYQSDVLPAASSPGRLITLTLNSDNSLTMVADYLNGEAPITQAGAWAEGDDGRLTVTLTGAPGETDAKPEVIVFAQEDGQLVAVEYDLAMWGEEGLTLAAVVE